MKKILIYSKKVCAYCVSAKKLMRDKGVTFEEILVDDRPELYKELREKTGHMTVPQIFIGEKFIGGYSELRALEDAGELDHLIK